VSSHHSTNNAQWHHSSYSAFCRNFGTHCTNAIGSRCWNEEAIASMKRSLNKQWAEFVDDVQVEVDDVKQFIASTFTQMIREASKLGIIPTLL
jgi:glucan phosphorylase